jgi:hypothetical protein
MERGCRFGKCREGFDQSEDALSSNPVSDAQEGRRPCAAQIIRRGLGRRRDVAPGRDDPKPFRIDAASDELGGERLARNEEPLGPRVREAVEPRLDQGARRAVIDAARGLVQDRYDGHARVA